ncbi:MAG: polynucleotide adenylyltransferase PcnB [Myxococcota bacterium]
MSSPETKDPNAPQDNQDSGRAGQSDVLEAAISDAFDRVIPPGDEDEDTDRQPEQGTLLDVPAREAPGYAAGSDDVEPAGDDVPQLGLFGEEDEEHDEDEDLGEEEDEEEDEDAEELAAAAGGDAADDIEIDVDDPAEAARLAALASDLDQEAADEAPEGEIPVDRIDEDALKVVRRLHHFGYEAYLVGGCVRDLLLGRTPKDFDVATSAEPNQIRQIFRNCRLIGRRFRLAHIYFFGGKVIETSTFRANPLDEMDDLPKDLLISQDNVFGTSQEDARRRDFTINALFYDPQTGKVVDHVGGRQDLDARIIRTIGDPDVRLREDPVRILRAVKFAARLGFDVDPATRDAMARHAPEITRCAAPRVLEEIYRLLACGASRPAFNLLMELGMIPILMPEIAPALGYFVQGGPSPNENGAQVREEVLGTLDALDAVKQRGVEPSHALSMGTLLLRLYLRLQSSGQDPNRWLDDVSASMVARLRLTRRDRERLRVLLQTQKHLAPERRRGGQGRATVRRGPFLESLLLYTVHLVATGGDLAEVGQWKALARAEGQQFRPGEVVDREPREWGRGGGGERGREGGRGGEGPQGARGPKPEGGGGGRRKRRRGRRGGRR